MRQGAMRGSGRGKFSEMMCNYLKLNTFYLSGSRLLMGKNGGDPIHGVAKWGSWR